MELGLECWQKAVAIPETCFEVTDSQVGEKASKREEIQEGGREVPSSSTSGIPLAEQPWRQGLVLQAFNLLTACREQVRQLLSALKKNESQLTPELQQLVRRMPSRKAKMSLDSFIQL